MVWELRYYETDSQGRRKRRSVTVGSLAEHPTESAVRPNLRCGSHPTFNPYFFESIRQAHRREARLRALGR